MENSPSTTTNTTAPAALYANTCQMYEGKNDTETDLGSPLIDCSFRKCKYWVHFICLGLECLDEDMNDFADQFKFGAQHIRKLRSQSTHSFTLSDNFCTLCKISKPWFLFYLSLKRSILEVS